MNDQDEKLTNPYVAPSSNLTGDFDAAKEWDEFYTNLADRFWRDYCYGVYLSFCICISAIVACDSYLHGWKQALFGPIPNGMILLIALFVTSAFIIPSTKSLTRYYKRKYELHRFISLFEKNLRKWYEWTITVTILILIGVGALWLFFSWRRFGFDLSLLALYGRALIVLPIVGPAVYFVMRRAKRKALSALKQMQTTG